jgi:tetratricopeptide (TPR) repeat protein
MWKRFSKSACTALILTLLLSGGCAIAPERSTGQGPVDVTPVIREHYHQAIEAMKAGQWDAAITGLESITRENDRLSGPYLNLGIAYTQAGDKEKAIAALQTSIERNPDNPIAYNQLGILYRQSGEFEQAQTMYENALRADPACADAQWNLGVLNDLYLQQPAEAQQHYERYRQLTDSEERELQPEVAGIQQKPATEQLTVGVRQP